MEVEQIIAMSVSAKIPWLCSLPRELRDQIIEIVFLAETEASEFPRDEDLRREERQSEGSVYYEHTVPPTNLQGLLGCSRQLRQESLDFISRHSASDGSAFQYKLDLAIWGCSLYPTWLYLPVPPKYIKQVTVQLRMFNHCEGQWADPWIRNDDERYGILTLYLLQMLRRFLHYGPSFATSPPGRPNTRPLYPMHIDRLQIDFANMATKIVFFDGKKIFAPLSPEWKESWLNLEPFAFSEFLLNVKKIARIGILHGSIDEVRVQYKQIVQSWSVPDSRDKALAAKILSPYGWGPVLRITQKAVDEGRLTYSEALDCRPRLSCEETGGSRQLEDTSIANFEEYGRGWKSQWE